MTVSETDRQQTANGSEAATLAFLAGDGNQNHRPGRVTAVCGSVVEVEFPDSLPGIDEALLLKDGERTVVLEVAHHLDQRTLRGIAMGYTEGLFRGMPVERTGKPITVPVGPETLGRIFNALREPLDGREPLTQAERWPIHRPAPSLAAQRGGLEFLETGIKSIDLLAPLVRGGKAGLIGGAGVGKTVLLQELIRAMNQTRRGVAVFADADSPPGHQYICPYTACTIGEYFMSQGRHVLVVYDDLTKHADAYRRASLLLGRPPGREAYPADIFYLHARLLARATKLHERHGGGSLTAFPIATTQAGNISAYIPSNLISITDGQLCLDARLFNEGVRPAIDMGLSVSRVGGKAQPALLRRLAGDLRLLYAQFHELETFARFGAELEPETRRRLERGRRLREALKQPRLRPWSLGREAATLFAIREGLVDEIAVEQVSEFLEALSRRLTDQDTGVLSALESGDDLTHELQDRLRQSITAAQRAFLARRGE